MADKQITLEDIAADFLDLAGPGEATAGIVYDIKKDLRSLYIHKDGRVVVDYGFNSKLLTMTRQDFRRIVLVPLTDLFASGIDHGAYGFHSVLVQECATARTA